MDPAKDLTDSGNYQACCISYAEKMKDEIKKEVIEEVLQILKQTRPFCSGSSDTGIASGNTSEASTEVKVLHSGIYCDHCDQQIYGVRYKCWNCEDYDLCEECEKIPGIHSNRHVFLKLRLPVSLVADRADEPNVNDACMVRSEDGSYVFRPKSIPAKTHKKPGLEKKTTDKPREYDAKFLFDETVEDLEVVDPGKCFLKKWRVTNTGLTSWEKDVTVQRLYGSDDFKTDSPTIVPPPLKPGEEGIVSVYFTAPTSDGVYESYWEFKHVGKSFGDTLWCQIRVGKPVAKLVPLSYQPAEKHPKYPSSKSFFADQQMQCLIKSRRKAKEERKKRKDCRKKEVKQQIVDVLTFVQEEQGCRRSSSESLKPVITSHTATPNNTPFDLSPPKSPEPREFIELKADTIISFADTGLPSLEKVKQHVNIANESDEKFSITTVSSSESDSEFVVIPMPKCFSALDNISTSQIAVSQTFDAVTTEEPQPDIAKCSGSSELVSQETGAPEEAENLNLNTAVHVKESCGEKKVITSAIHISGSPSSSSVSVIESEDNSSPSAPSAPPLLVETKQEPAITLVTTLEQDSTVSAQEDQNGNDSPQSCTFPKFPLEIDENLVVTATTTTASSTAAATSSCATITSSSPLGQDHERTIQVLPEGLVTGALIAAASIYNTAKAAISSIQPVRNEQVDHSPTSSNALPNIGLDETEPQSPLQQLIEMGFNDQALNERLLREKNSDVAAVVAELVNMDDNDWYASRSATSDLTRN